MRWVAPRIVFMMGVLSSFGGQAEEGLPVGCKPIAVEEESVVLSAPNPMLVLIHNRSELDLWITHLASDPTADAGWSNRLQSQKWSALAVHDQAFELVCIESKPGHEQQLPCANLLDVCQWVGADLSKQKLTGTFWAAEDQTLPTLKASLGRRGIELPA